MRPTIQKGFLVYEAPPESLVIACPHAGPTFKGVVNRDEFTETVGGFLWKKTGGKLVVSTLPRSRSWGIDYNRGIPPKDVATKMHKVLVEDSRKDDESHETPEIAEFMKKYGWTALNDSDYDQRLKCYQAFWGCVEQGKTIILIHRQASRFKNIPSMMDVTSFGSVKHSVMMKAVKKVNKKFANFLEMTQADYRRMIALETKRKLLQMMKVYGSVDPRKVGVYHTAYLKDLSMMKKYADNVALNRLKNTWNEHNVFHAFENALQHIPTPKVTHEEVFKGELSHGPLRKLFPKNERKVLQVECSSFILYWHPIIAARMIEELYKNVRD